MSVRWTCSAPFSRRKSCCASTVTCYRYDGVLYGYSLGDTNKSEEMKMAKLAASIDAICGLIVDKVEAGYGISSPQAASLDEKLSEFENELTALNIFPSDWTHKHSIGKGNLASVVWVVFLPPGQTTQDGIYVSFCFGKAGNGLVTGCAISNTSQKKYSYITTVERLHPEIDVDGTRKGTHYNNGFVNPLEVFAGEVDENVLLNHMRESIKKCKECLMVEAPNGNVMSDAAKSRYELWKKFLDRWPSNKVSSLTLSEYTSFGQRQLLQLGGEPHSGLGVCLGRIVL